MATIQLQDLVWPVFRLGEKQPQVQDLVVFYSTEYTDLDTDSAAHTLRIVDDRSIPKPSLGQRRLQLKNSAKLFPIGTAVYFLADLIKLAKPTTWFIDSQGRVFQHKKSTRAKLASYKIKKVLPVQGVGCVLELDGISTRFKSIHRPQAEETYAAVISWNKVQLLYGYLTHPIKTTWRLV